jgi:CheY-like chemotaxis protein
MEKILLVEDNRTIISTVKLSLANIAEVLAAETVEEARLMFAQNPDIVLIAMDGRLHSGHIETVELTREIRSQFSGVMVAISGDYEAQKLLIEAGCDRHCYKGQIIPFLTKWLGARTQRPR